MKSEVFSGARAVLKIGESPVGYAVGCSGSTGINYQPLSVLGHLEVVEHVPVAYQVEFSANMARLASHSDGKGSRLGSSTYPESTTASPQIMPAFGTTSGLNILQSGDLTAYIYDRVSQKTLYTIKGVKCAQKSWDIQAGGMVAENCVFVARLSEEAGEADSPIA